MNEPCDLEKMVQATGGMTVFEGDYVPEDVEWHLCTNRPVFNTSNLESRCGVCNCPVYHSEPLPKVKKICPACALKMARTTPCQSIANTGSIRRAILNGQKNCSNSLGKKVACGSSYLFTQSCVKIL